MVMLLKQHPRPRWWAAVLVGALVCAGLAGCEAASGVSGSDGPDGAADRPASDGATSAEPTPTATTFQPGDPQPTLPFPAFPAGDTTEGIPREVIPQFTAVRLGAAWSSEPGVLWVMAAGTSCPTTAAVVTSGPDVVRVALGIDFPADDSGCLEISTPYTTSLVMPDGRDDGKPLTVMFESPAELDPYFGGPGGVSGSVTVPPRLTPGAAGRGAWVTNPDDVLDPSFLAPIPGNFAAGVPSQTLHPTSNPGDGSQIIAGAAWTATPGVLFVMTWGSSGCPLLARSATMTEGGVRVALAVDDPSLICTDDFAATTSIVVLPDGVDTGELLDVTLGDLGTVTVAPRDTEANPGLAAWLMG